MSAAIRLGLLGAPNSGKTTLFNALTGMRAKVANYPGVTVERREAQVRLGSREAVVIDLPGTYSLEPLSPDEEVVTRVLDGELAAAPDALVVVADACSLERSLPFVAQVLLRGRPTCLVLTMIDELAARGGTIDLARLEYNGQSTLATLFSLCGIRNQPVEKQETLIAALPPVR